MALAVVLPLNEATAGTLDRVRQAGKLMLGYRADARPLSFRDEAGKPAGYSVELCQKIADQVRTELGLPGLSVEWVPVTIEERFRAVQEHRVDLLCGTEGATLERRKVVDFSIAVFPGGIGAIVRADAPDGLRDILEGRRDTRPRWRASPAQVIQRKTLSVVAGTVSERWLAERLNAFNLTAKVVQVDSYDAGIRGVLDRRADAFFAERTILLDAARRSSSAGDLVVLDRRFTYEPLALALERGDEDFRLLVDRTLSALYGSKEFTALYARWFGAPGERALEFFRWVALPQ